MATTDLEVEGKRSRKSALKLADPSNDADPATATHQKDRVNQQLRDEEERLAHEAEKKRRDQQRAAKRTQRASLSAQATSAPSHTATPPPQDNIPEETAQEREQPARTPDIILKKRTIIEVDTDDESPATEPSPAVVRKQSRIVPDAPLDPTVTEDGFLADIDVQLPDADGRDTSRKGLDIIEFFGNPFDAINGSGKMKKHRKCKKCNVQLVADVSTLRRHCESFHEGRYRQWAVKNNFESMLPGDARKRKEALKAEALKQTQLDGHLREMPKKERVQAYTHAVFRRALLEWLIATGQPISALEHPKFKEMIDIASRAQGDAQIPSRKVARSEIIHMFHSYMTDLKKSLNSEDVTGAINVTCDGWQADNVDAYFCTTIHFIKQTGPNEWKLESALAGFIRLNSAHHGVRLGQTLFKVLDRLGVAHRIGHVTCDNASNNGTMLREFARVVKAKKNVVFNPTKQRINCVAHVINLATQALISTYSKAPHFDPAQPDKHMPDTTTDMRDEIGLIRAICVKERSSAKRKEMYRSIQIKVSITIPRQLLLDMKVRWSSTFIMLIRAVTDKSIVNEFIIELVREEKDNSKRQKLMLLALQESEWQRAEAFVDLLAHADRHQQAFSSETHPCLHHAIPALESLHKAWSSRAQKIKYEPFANALEVASDKVAEYYDKTEDSDAYIVSTYLVPDSKGAHFKKHWSLDLQAEAERMMSNIFASRYQKLSGNGQPPPRPTKPKLHVRIMGLNRELSDSEDDTDVTPTTSAPTSQPWEQEFRRYLDTIERVPHGMDAIAWWGLHASEYPVWASLARDYLSIQATSVSSERAFSQGGITLSKRRNRLKGDIVEALQCLKCALRKDLLVRESGPSSADEDAPPSPRDLGDGDEGEDLDGAGDSTQVDGAWDLMLDDSDELYADADHDTVDDDPMDIN